MFLFIGTFWSENIKRVIWSSMVLGNLGEIGLIVASVQFSAIEIRSIRRGLTLVASEPLYE